MVQTIRFNTFETNSSSTHNCVICTEQEYQDWKDGKIYWNRWPDKDEPIFLTRDDVIKMMEKDEFTDERFYEDDGVRREDYNSEEEFMTAKIDSYCRSEGEIESYETFDDDLETETHTREINGQKVIVKCNFGYDN